MITDGKFIGVANAEAAIAELIEYENRNTGDWRGIDKDDITLVSHASVPTPMYRPGYDYLKAVFSAKAGGRYSNGGEITYRRVPVDNLAAASDLSWSEILPYLHLPLSGATVEPTTLHGMLDHFNAFFGLELRPIDIVDQQLAIDNGVRFCKLELTQSSRLIGNKIGNRDVWVFFGTKNPATQTNPFLQLQSHVLPDSYFDINTISYTEGVGFNITTTPEARLLTALENDLGKAGGTFNGPSANLDVVVLDTMPPNNIRSTIIPRPNSIYFPQPETDPQLATFEYRRFDLANFNRRFLPHAQQTIQINGGETVGVFIMDLADIDPERGRTSMKEILEWFNATYRANLRISLTDWPNLEEWYNVTNAVRAFTPGGANPFYEGSLYIKITNSNV